MDLVNATFDIIENHKKFFQIITNSSQLFKKLIDIYSILSSFKKNANEIEDYLDRFKNNLSIKKIKSINYKEDIEKTKGWFNYRKNNTLPENEIEKKEYIASNNFIKKSTSILTGLGIVIFFSMNGQGLYVDSASFYLSTIDSVSNPYMSNLLNIVLTSGFITSIIALNASNKSTTEEELKNTMFQNIKKHIIEKYENLKETIKNSINFIDNVKNNMLDFFKKGENMEVKNVSLEKVDGELFIFGELNGIDFQIQKNNQNIEFNDVSNGEFNKELEKLKISSVEMFVKSSKDKNLSSSLETLKNQKEAEEDFLKIKSPIFKLSKEDIIKKMTNKNNEEQKPQTNKMGI